MGQCAKAEEEKKEKLNHIIFLIAQAFFHRRFF